MRMFTCILVTSLLLQALPAGAAGIFRFTFDSPPVELAPGASITLPLFLEEKVNAGQTSLMEEEGIFSAAARIERAPAPAAPVAISALVANTDLFNEKSLAGEFTPLYLPLTDSLAGFSARRDMSMSAGVRGSLQGDIVRIELARITFTAGDAPGLSSTFHVGDFDPLSSDTVSWSLPPAVLDDQIAPATLTLRVVPEPRMALLLLLPLLVLRRFRPARQAV